MIISVAGPRPLPYPFVHNGTATSPSALTVPREIGQLLSQRCAQCTLQNRGVDSSLLSFFGSKSPPTTLQDG